MVGSQDPNIVFNEAQLDELLLDLNTHATGPEELRAWASDTTIALDRVTATPALVYVRLSGHNEQGPSKSTSARATPSP